MDELSDYISETIEFKPIASLERHQRLVDNCTAPDIMLPSKDVSLETNPKRHAESQTQTIADSITAAVDEKKLAAWLRKVAPIVEAEILKGATPLIDSYIRSTSSYDEAIKIQTYQKISFNGGMGALDSSQGLATWLSVHTNNAPVLVVTTVAPHDDWCEHVNQSISIFVPKRVQTGNFVVFTEMKSIPVKACLKSLATNAYNKNIFVGSTLDGDIYIWCYEQSSNPSQNVVVTELFNFTSPHGYATAMDWAAENRLLTCHSNGYITQWLMGKQMLKESDYLLRPPPVNGIVTSNEITMLVCLDAGDFVLGTKDGGVYHCASFGTGTLKKQLEITPLRRHLFMVTSLLKTKISGHVLVISCDLSGQVYYHDIRNSDDDIANVIVQIPLPFKNSIACSRDTNIIYCPGIDGSLECFNLQSGVHSIIKGALRGKGSLIKCSDNGYWIITGLYNDEFQIFNLES